MRVGDAVVARHPDELVVDQGDEGFAVVVVDGREVFDLGVSQIRVHGEEAQTRGLSGQRLMEPYEALRVGRLDRSHLHHAAVGQERVEGSR